MKKILILGSTGSIGTTALELIRNDRDKFKVVGISGNKNLALLEKQIEEFEPENICIGDKKNFEYLQSKYINKKIYFGDEGLKNLAKETDYDIILTAVSGAIGIDATVEAIKREKIIALANKETMVAAGSYINELLKKYKAKIIPVDSEHSAIFQAINGNRKEDIKRLIITASGGTFRGKKREDLISVTAEQALKHPNWSMGKKITVDSSTLVNKGLEVIEAHELFNLPYDKISVVVHPQSIIHSMVEYRDGSIIAQMGVPSMKTPILYALNYPERYENESISFLDFYKNKSLTFEEPDRETFKAIDMAYEVGKKGQSFPIVFNAANEVAVDLFLNGKIKFLDIYSIIEEEIKNHRAIDIEVDNALELIKQVDSETRKRVRAKWGN